MDKNKLIGLILISTILIFYTHFWGPKPTPKLAQEPDTLVTQEPSLNSLKDASPAITDPNGIFTPRIHAAQEQEVILENEDMKVTLTSRGGTVKEVVLKHYLDHQAQPLSLLDAQSSKMGFHFTANKVAMNTSELHFITADKHQYIKEQEVGKATFTFQLGLDQFIRQSFSLPSHGYELTQYWEIVGLENQIDPGSLGFVWHDLIKRAEKDLQACRNKSTVNYYLADQSFQHLKERSDKLESQTIEKSIKWLSIKQRFFIAGIVAEEPFTSGRIELNPTLQSEVTVKDAKLWLTLPASKNENNKEGKFLFYFGPNDYKILKKVAPGFSKNLSLGWPVVKWINQFLILPTFSFLEQHISNYGIIILLLVVLLKVLLWPLSYKSYISMAEMKVLKPDLDKIKSQYGNDLQKLQMEQAKLYREMGINPLSGCIPVFLQMPILLAMFNFFPNVIDLRQKAFLWAPDLSTYDAIIHLPFQIPAYGSHVSLFTLLMTISTILYTWSNNQISAPQGPMKTMSYLLPITFMFVLNSFPAGLSFYYFVSNIITFGQQAMIKSFVDEEKIKAKLAAHKQKSGQGQKNKFKLRLQEAIRRKK